MPTPRSSGKSGLFERWLTRLSHGLSVGAHSHLEATLLRRASVILTVSRRAASLLGGAHPSCYSRIACLPARVTSRIARR